MIVRFLYIPDEREGGGDPPNKNPPKGYKPLSVSQRRDWNDMLDKMQSDGVAGSKYLDQSDKNVGASFIEKYKKENPETSVTADMIPYVQYEHQQLRSGESFAGMSPEQTRVLRTQLNPDYIKKEVAEPGTSLNSAMSRQYYPEFKKGDKKYGTDAEGYMKDFSTNRTSDSNVESKEKEGTKKGGGDDRIPLPNYNDTTSRSNYLKQWTKKYGDLEGRGDTVLKVNEVPRGGSDTAKNISTKVAKKYGLDPSLLYSSAMEEGMSGLFKDKSGVDTKHRKPGDFGYQDFYSDKEYPVSGKESFGLNTFADRFPDLVKGGYLPKDFSKNFRNTDDGAGEGNFKNNFKNVESAMQAKAAIVKYSYDDIDKYASQKGIKLSKEAKDFFALAEYNGGEGTAHSMIKDYNDNGLLEGNKFLEKRPTSGTNLKDTSYKDVYDHVVRRIKMATALKKEKHFEDGDTH